MVQADRRNGPALRAFLASEAAGGLVLIAAAALALLAANGPLAGLYHALLEEPIGGFVPLTAYPPIVDGTLLVQHNTPTDRAAQPRAPFTAAALAVIAVFAFGVLWHLGVVLRQVREFFRHPAFVHGAVVVTVGKHWARVRHWGDTSATERAQQRYHERYRTSEDLRDRWIAHLQKQRFNAVQRVFVLPWRPRDLRRTAHLLMHAAFAVLGLVAAWWTLLATRASGVPKCGSMSCCACMLTSKASIRACLV